MSARRWSPELAAYIKTDAEIAADLEDRIARGEPWSLTSAPGELTNEQKRVVEAYVARSFANWAESWLVPLVGHLRARAGLPHKDVRAVNARHRAGRE